MARKNLAYTVTSPTGLNLRAMPSMDAEILRVLKEGELVKAANTKAPDGWTAVEDGFVRSEYIK